MIAPHQPSSGSGTSPFSSSMSARSRSALLRRRAGSAAARSFIAIRSAIVKHVAQAHGGTLRIESAAGHGLRARVLLPLRT